MNKSNQPRLFEGCYDFAIIMDLYFSLGVVFGILGCVSFVGNLSICLLIGIYRRTFRHLQYTLVFLLALSDLLNTSIALPLEVAAYVTESEEEYIFSPAATIFQNAIWYSLNSLSILSLMLISLEKFITIRYPLSYVYILTKRKVTCAIVFVWIQVITTFIASCCLQRWPKPGFYDYDVPQPFRIAVMFFNFLLPSVINFICYGYIFKVVVKQRRRDVQSKTTGKNKNKHDCWMSHFKMTRNLKNVRPFTYLICSFFFLWGPFIGYETFQTLNLNFYYTCKGELFNSLLTMITFGNCVGNIFIYGALDKKFRKVFRKTILSRLKC